MTRGRIAMPQNFCIVRLRDEPQRLEDAAAWFHAKWGIPLTAYRDSMLDCVSLEREDPVPQWYLVIAPDGSIAGGCGVIDNDFHDRPDLTPNVCAVYVEEPFRCRGIAGAMLEAVCLDMSALGIDTLYLLTDHVGFYERYAWSYYCSALGDGEEKPSRMYRRCISEGLPG